MRTQILKIVRGNKTIMNEFTKILVGLILSLIAWIAISYYPNEAQVKEEARAIAKEEVQSAICPIKEDISEIKLDVKDILKRIKQ